MTSTYIGGDSELSELWKCVWDSFLPETVAQKIMQYYPLPWEFNFVLGRRAIDILLHWRSCQLPTILVSVTTRLFFIPSSQSSPLSFFLSFLLSFLLSSSSYNSRTVAGLSLAHLDHQKYFQRTSRLSSLRFRRTKAQWLCSHMRTLSNMQHTSSYNLLCLAHVLCGRIKRVCLCCCAVTLFGNANLDFGKCGNGCFCSWLGVTFCLLAILSRWFTVQHSWSFICDWSSSEGALSARPMITIDCLW